MNIEINYLAVLIAAVANFIIGFSWYSPVLFSKPWMRLSGIDPSLGTKQQMYKGMAIGAISSLVMAYVLAHFVALMGVMDLAGAIQLGIWAWLGFVATTMSGIVAWEGKPWALYFINAGYYLVSLVVMSGILTLWK